MVLMVLDCFPGILPPSVFSYFTNGCDTSYETNIYKQQRYLQGGSNAQNKELLKCIRGGVEERY